MIVDVSVKFDISSASLGGEESKSSLDTVRFLQPFFFLGRYLFKTY